MIDQPEIQLSKHARRRCYQRGFVPVSILAIVALKVAEAEWPKVVMTIIDKDTQIVYNHATGMIITVKRRSPMEVRKRIYQLHKRKP
jgi:hypothetical protein